MGTEVDLQEFSRSDRTRHREKVRQCLDVFARMLRESRFDVEDPMTGMEIEFNLVDDEGRPALKSAEALEAIANPLFQTELAQFNLEINVLPRRLGSRGVSGFEDDLRSSLNEAERKANEVDAHMVMIGILPTLEDGHLSPSKISPNPRYKLLSDQILAARGEDLVIDIRGIERLRTTSDSIMPEAACTSTQLHTQVSPDNFAAYWNASQAVSSIQLAVGANSPYLLGKQLFQETRIPLFEQATDTRSEELKEQGVRPRVWFGERWITSIFDLFEENVRYFPALLPITDDEDPLEVLERGGTPSLSELKLHNGTIYRWNRPVYDVVDDVPHLRVREPGARSRADRGRHDGQCGLLLRARASARRGRPAALVADVLLRSRGELPRGGPARDRLARLLAGDRRGGGHRARAAAPAPARPRRSGHLGSGARRGRPPADDHRAALRAAPQRGLLVRRPGARPRGGRRQPCRVATADPAGVPRADARQRARAHLAPASEPGRPEPGRHGAQVSGGTVWRTRRQRRCSPPTRSTQP